MTRKAAAAPGQPPLPLVAIFADESCLGNGREGSNPGGGAGVIEYVGADGRLTRWDYWISEPGTTNNRMALKGFIEGLRLLSRKGKRFRVVFTSDSQYLVKGVKEWLPGWIRRGWTRKGGAIENLGLWQSVVGVVADHQLSPRWVRGHAGHPQNEYANFLAIRAAREQTSSNGVLPSGFDEWLTRERAAGRVQEEPAAFPDSASFRGLPAYPVSISPSLID